MELEEDLRLDADMTPATVARWRDEGRGVLPDTLHAAIETFGADATLRRIYGSPIDTVLLQVKRAEWQRYHASVSGAERAMYLAPS